MKKKKITYKAGDLVRFVEDAEYSAPGDYAVLIHKVVELDSSQSWFKLVHQVDGRVSGCLSFRFVHAKEYEQRMKNICSL